MTKHKETAKIVMNRWIKRNVIDQSHIDFYSYDVIEAFLKDIYLKLLSKKDKENFCFWLQSKKPLSDITLKSAEEYASSIRSIRATEGNIKYVNRITKEARKIRYERQVELSSKTRIEKEKTANPLLSDEDALYESYLNGMRTKGTKVAEELNIPIGNLSPAELMHLSGYTKKENFSNWSDEKKHEKRIHWKKQNLLHKTIQDSLCLEYPEFSSVIIDTLSDDEVDKWYAQYASIISTRTMLSYNGERATIKYNGWGKSGYFNSVLMNRSMFYRSSYELLILEHLDRRDDIEFFQAEPYAIKLAASRYLPDIKVICKNGIEKIIEIKPEYRLNGFLEKKGNEVIQMLGSTFVILTTESIDKQRGNLHAYISTILYN